MARNAGNQFPKRGDQILFDYGYVTLGSDGTIAVYTTLKRVHACFAGHRTAPTAASVLRVANKSGDTVTITDPAEGVNSGITVWYLFVGVG